MRAPAKHQARITPSDSSELMRVRMYCTVCVVITKRQQQERTTTRHQRCQTGSRGGRRRFHSQRFCAQDCLLLTAVRETGYRLAQAQAGKLENARGAAVGGLHLQAAQLSCKCGAVGGLLTLNELSHAGALPS